MFMKKNYFISLVILIGSLPFLSQNFSGTIEFKFISDKDTTNNIYTIKEKMVRLDQYSKKGNGIEGSFIIDLNAKEIKFTNPKRKLWGRQTNETPQVIKGVCSVTKSGATKKIAGINCSEYVVKNTDENTTISYWITEGKYSFFIPLIKLWNRKDKQSVYFNQIKNLSEGAMPLMSEEHQISDNKLLSKLEATKIEIKTPENSAFEIPTGYTKFDK